MENGLLLAEKLHNICTLHIFITSIYSIFTVHVQMN